MRSTRARIEHLEERRRRRQAPARVTGFPLPRLNEEEANQYCDILDRVWDQDPARRAKVLGILSELGEEGFATGEVLARASHAAGLTMAAILERADGLAILSGLRDAYFADLEGGDHADIPNPT